MADTTSPDVPAVPEGAVDPLGSRVWMLVVAIVVFGCGRRLWGFDQSWLNPDEGIYFSMATWNTWGDFWRECSENAHPPLFYLLVRLVSLVTTETWALRSIALVCGCACVPATFLFARECVGRGRVATLTGLFAAMLVAQSFTAVEMSQIIRPYTMQIAAMTFALYFLVRYLRVGGRGALPAYASLMIVAVLTHYGSLLVLAGLGAALLGMIVLRRINGRQCRALLLANVPVLGTAAAVYFLHIRSSLDGSDIANLAVQTWLKPVMIHGAGDVWPRVLGALSAFGALFEGPAGVAFLVGLGIAAYRRNYFVVLVALAVLAVAIGAAVAHKYPLGYTRHSLYLTMVFAPPIAFAVASLLTWGRKTAVSTGLAMVALLVFHGEVSTVLRSDGRVRAFENTLTREDVGFARPAIDTLSNRPGFLLMAAQTYNVLMPLYYEERQQAVVTADGSIRRFRWRQREVLVLDTWNLSMHPQALGTKFHLYDAILDIDRKLPELRFSQQRSVALFVGGWGKLADEIVNMMENGTPEQKRVVKGGGGVPGISAFDLDIAAYMTMMRASRRSGR